MEELKKLTTRVVHVLPMSDDGGSTAEIVHMLLQVFNAVVQNYPSRPYLAYNVNYDSTMSMDM